MRAHRLYLLLLPGRHKLRVKVAFGSPQETDATAIRLLFNEAYYNYLDSWYPCWEDDAIQLASRLMQLSQGDYDPRKHAQYLSRYLKYPHAANPSTSAGTSSTRTQPVDRQVPHTASTPAGTSSTRTQPVSRQVPHSASTSTGPSQNQYQYVGRYLTQPVPQRVPDSASTSTGTSRSQYQYVSRYPTGTPRPRCLQRAGAPQAGAGGDATSKDHRQLEREGARRVQEVQPVEGARGPLAPGGCLRPTPGLHTLLPPLSRRRCRKSGVNWSAKVIICVYDCVCVCLRRCCRSRWRFSFSLCIAISSTSAGTSECTVQLSSPAAFLPR